MLSRFLRSPDLFYQHWTGHAHEESMKNGHDVNKMLRSTSYNGFGDALTTQPQPSRSTNKTNVSGGMDLSYVTERIISLWFPSNTNSHAYRQGQQQAAHMLRNKHGDNYMVFNLSEPKRALRSEHKHVKEVGWSPTLAPPLERLCSVCKEIESWLSGDQHRIAVLHARGNKDKLGVIVAAYMHYSSICGNAEQALDRFSMRKFLDDNVGPLAIPSNKRYVEYFAGLLSHNIKINASPMYLTHVTVLGAPAFQSGGCKAFLKVYEGHTPVYTSGIYSVSSGTTHFTVNMTGEGGRKGGLRLRGDVLVKCYHRSSEHSRETVFACQFHTCAVADNTLSFTRQELDVACDDTRFPADGAVELHFSPGPEGRHPVPAPTPAVPFTIADDHVTRADSPLLIEQYDNDEDEYDEDDVNHTFGPLDGSIYATIAKKPELSPGAVSSPLTVSMDSGISSAGHQQNANTTASASPPPTSSSAQPSPLTPEDHHRQLDELLSDMMLTVQSIPDLKPSHNDFGNDARFGLNDSDTRARFGIDDSEGRARYDVNDSDSRARFAVNDSDSRGRFGIDDSDSRARFPVNDSDSRARFGIDDSDVRYIDDDDDRGIPYHARQASQPFSYGVSAEMVAMPEGKTGAPQGLSSPGLVRKASGSRSSTLQHVNNHQNNSNNRLGNGDTLQRVQTRVYPGDFPSPVKPSTLPYSKRDPIDNIFTEEALKAQPLRREFREEFYKEEVKRFDPLKRSLTEGTIQRNPEKSYKVSPTSQYSDSVSLSPPGAFRNSTRSPEFHEGYATGGSNLTWLQRQQQKLKERRELVLREERQPHETRLLSELRTVQSRHMRPTASHRLDGYTSDTTAFADDDDEDYRIPLHINTAHKNGSHKSSNGNSYSTTVNNERPFMTVKRAHERYAQNGTTTPAQILAAHPMGQIVGSPSRTKGESEGIDQPDGSGLLSLVKEQQHQQQVLYKLGSSQQPRYNGQRTLRREESVQSWRSGGTTTEPDSSPSHASSPRPQTPAFPVHARTPYSNSSSSATPTAHVQFDLSATAERLPPKSPTTQRRLSFPSSSANKNSMKWSFFPERKDRPTSPTELSNGSATEYSHTLSHRSVSTTPNSSFRESTETSYQHSPKSHTQNGSYSPTVYYGTSRRSSVNSNESPHEVSAANVKFVRDSSKYWYKSTISREQAITILRDQQPGTFVVRDSNSFPGAFGLALRVATIPSNVQNKTGTSDELIRHFLIEPTSRGVRLKGCQNEPVFTSLSALIYQHSITQMALPCKLILPEDDLRYGELNGSQQQQQSLFTQGAACNVLYLATMDMESLTGPQAVKKAVTQLFQESPLPRTATVHFKVSDQGVTLTDNKRKLFFRRHYPVGAVSHCGVDPDDRRWLVDSEEAGASKSTNRIFGFVARKPNVSNPDNQCHLFAELEPEQPATAIVNFLNKVLTSSGVKPNIV
ncbi:unnamed protein product [Phaedon cochleariae]|uniref:Tensin n=1 Tax=Phaedon cochleariae TaxID=80249 RepID=A0A9N9SE78_PHACE|nr:unnamed protein product [Phaedon cochleariae]